MRKLAFVSLVLLLILPGCLAEMAAHRMIAPPNGGRMVMATQVVGVSALLDTPYTVTVGPPTAKLRFWVTDPKPVEAWAVPRLDLVPAPTGDVAGRMVSRFGPTPQGVAQGWYQVLRYPAHTAIKPAAYVEPVGTVIVLHGYSGSLRHNAYLVPWVGVFADAGYRVVVLEQRGHGDSTGDTVTYGVFESRDLVQVIDDLQRRGLIAGPLAVFGHSMGGSVAILAAARDPRIDAVIAVAPFSSLAEEIRDFVIWKAPWSRWVLTDWFIDRALNAAGRQGGFDPADADPARAVTHTDTPLLLLHGSADPIVPVRHSRAIYRARPEGTDLVVFPGADHWSLMKIQFERFRALSLRWLAERLEEVPPRPAPIPASAETRVEPAQSQS